MKDRFEVVVKMIIGSSYDRHIFDQKKKEWREKRGTICAKFIRNQNLPTIGIIKVPRDEK